MALPSVGNSSGGLRVLKPHGSVNWDQGGFIGYSFPVADLYFSSVLRSVLASRNNPPKLVLVNPDAVAIGTRIQDRFRLSKPLLHFGIEQFVDMSRARLMRDLCL